MATQAEIRQENDPQPDQVNNKSKDPLSLLETVFGPLTPRSKRKQFLSDLRFEYTDPIRWLFKWAWYMSTFVPWRAWRSLNIGLVIFEISALAIAHASLPVSLAQIAGETGKPA